jgi:AcrR family transcriptional regulator
MSVEAGASARTARESVIAAARACYAELGVEAARMEDIARRAGISRQHLYSFVSGRDQLLELAVLARLGEIGARLAEQATERAGDLVAVLVDQIADGVRIGREDPEFTVLAESMPRVRLNHILTSRDSPLHAINHRIYAPIFARAMAEGRLRTDVTTDSMVEWLQGVMTLLAGRDDLAEDEQRAMIESYIIPTLLA